MRYVERRGVRGEGRADLEKWMGMVSRCAVRADAGAATEAKDVLLVLPPAVVGLTPPKEALLHQATQPARHSSSPTILPPSHVIYVLYIQIL